MSWTRAMDMLGGAYLGIELATALAFYMAPINGLSKILAIFFALRACAVAARLLLPQWIGQDGGSAVAITFALAGTLVLWAGLIKEVRKARAS